MVDRKKRKGSRRASVPKANAKAKAKTHSTGGGRDAGPADPNLRLAIIDALVRAKRLSLSVPKARKRDAADAKVREALVRTPLTAELLGSLTELTWHGGHDIQHRIWPEWDGENDAFDIRGLAGIEALANLRKLDLMLLDVKDLKPLGALSELRELVFEGRVGSLAPVLDLPKLERFSVSNARYPKGKRSDEVLDALLGRGVAIGRLAGFDPKTTRTLALHNVSAIELRAFSASVWPQLEKLELTADAEVSGKNAFDVLLSGKITPRLRHLVIGYWNTEELCRGLPGSALLARLEALTLSAADDEMEAYLAEHKKDFAHLKLMPDAESTKSGNRLDNLDLDQLGYVALALGHPARALELFEAALKRAKSDKEAHWNGKGIALAQLGRREEALQAYEASMKLAPGLEPPMQNRAYLLRDMGRFDDSLRAFDDCLALTDDPEQKMFYLQGKAYCLDRLGRAKERDAALRTVLQYWEKRSAKKPSEPEAWFQLACTHGIAGDIKAGLTALNRGLAIDPKLLDRAVEEVELDKIKGNAQFEELVARRG